MKSWCSMGLAAGCGEGWIRFLTETLVLELYRPREGDQWTWALHGFYDPADSRRYASGIVPAKYAAVLAKEECMVACSHFLVKLAAEMLP